MVVYIIYSPSLDKYYIGQTDNFAGRLAKHIANDDAASFSVRVLGSNTCKIVGKRGKYHKKTASRAVLIKERRMKEHQFN